MNAITSFRLCKLSTHDLITKIDEQTDNIFKNQEVPVRHIEPKMNKKQMIKIITNEQ